MSDAERAKKFCVSAKNFSNSGKSLFLHETFREILYQIEHFPYDRKRRQYKSFPALRKYCTTGEIISGFANHHPSPC
eukprot:307243-Rhodomonas_salina.2